MTNTLGIPGWTPCLSRMERACLLGLLLGLQACAPTKVGEVVRPEAPKAATALEPEESGACDPSAPINVLTVDLPTSTRVALEATMKRGVAVVAHSCKQLRVLESCKLPGDYSFAGLSRKEDVVTLQDAVELGVNLPIGASRFAGQVARGTSIHIALVRVGTQRSLFDAVGRLELNGGCDGATHFVRGTTMGAFALSTSARGEVKATAEVFGVGASGQASSDRALEQKDGSLEACRTSRADAAAPPPECAVPVQLQLEPISEKTPDRKKSEQGQAEQSRPIDGMCPEGFQRSGEVCSRQAKTYLCSPGDEADCQKQCDAGDPGSCHNLAELLRERLHKEAMKQPLKADSNTLEGVREIEEKHEAIRKTYTPLYDKACEGGVAIACDRIYWVSKKPAEERNKALERACELGLGDSCRMASGRFLYNTEGRDMKKGRELLDRGCRLGSRSSCMQQVDSYFSPPDGSKASADDRRTGEAILERLCKVGDAYRCAEIARRRFAGDGLTRDEALGFSYLERACSLGDPLSCFSAGKMLLLGDGVGKDPARAQRYLEQSCPLEKSEQLDACSSVVGLFRGPKAPLKDPAQALVWLGRGCRNGSGGACLDLASMYESGEGIKKNETRALELYEQACASDSSPGCTGLVRLLKSRDQPRALELSRAQCKKGLIEFCHTAGEIAGKKAVEVLGADCNEQNSQACLELGKLLEKSDMAKATEVFRKLCPDGSGPTYACNAIKKKR